MSAVCPTELNFLVPFLQRANELVQVHPVMAYYCKFFAVSMALKRSNKFKRTTQTDVFLANLFDDLEEEKSKLLSHASINDLSQGAIYIREFAYRVFLSAERLESSPETLKKAPQVYLAALNFLQIYRSIFLEDETVEMTDEERKDEMGQVDEKSKYAKWRIVEIKRQINENSNYLNNQISSSPIHLNSPGIYNNPSSPPIINTEIKPEPTTTNTNTTTTINTTVDPKVLSECEKYARHAISALHFDDLETAAQNLNNALMLLQPFLVKK